MSPKALALALTLLGCVTLACGPVQSMSLIVDAQAELSAAKTADGDKHSPFEYYAAEEYLHKAREEQSYSEFEISVRFAKKSRDCAKLARARAEQATRATMGAGGERKMPKVKCRPGPEREGGVDANEEPAAKDPRAKSAGEPKDPEPARAGEPKDPPPAQAEPEKKPEAKKDAPKKDAAKKDEPKKDEPKKPIKPADEPMPEGDEGDK